MSFFDNIGRGLSSAFTPLYPDGFLHRSTEVIANNGDVTQSDSNTAIKAKRDAVTEIMKTDAGYSEKDVAVYVLNPDLSLQINTDDEVTCEGVRYRIGGPIRKDTVSSHFILRCSPA